jgi:hypothetical protein
LKSGSLNLLEPSGPAKACNGIALPFTDYYLGDKIMEDEWMGMWHEWDRSEMHYKFLVGVTGFL